MSDRQNGTGSAALLLLLCVSCGSPPADSAVPSFGAAAVTAKASGVPPARAAKAPLLSPQFPFQHPDQVRSIQWSPTATTLLTSADDGWVRLFDANGQLRRRVYWGGARAPLARYSPDGRHILVADDQILLFDAAAAAFSTVPPTVPMRPTQTLSGEHAITGGPVVAWSTDGAQIASYRWLTVPLELEPMIWSTADGRRVELPNLERLPVQLRAQLVFVNARSLLIMSGTHVRLIDTDTGDIIQRWTLPRVMGTLDAWQGEGVVIDRRGAYRLDRDNPTVQSLGRFKGPLDPALWSRGGALAAVGFGDRLTVVKFPSGIPIGSIDYAEVYWDVPSMRSRAVALDGSATRVAYAVFNHVEVRAPSSFERVTPEHADHLQPATQLSWSGDDTTLLSLGSQRLCAWSRTSLQRLWCETPKLSVPSVHRPIAPSVELPLVMMRTKDEQVALGSRAATATYHAANGSEMQRTNRSPISESIQVAPLANGAGWARQEYVDGPVVIHRRGKISSYELPNQVTDLQLACAATSANDKVRLLGFGEQGALLWKGGNQPRHLPERTDLCAVSSDGHWLILSDRHGIRPAVLWDTSKWQKARELTPFGGDQILLARTRMAWRFSPDGAWVAMAGALSSDKSVIDGPAVELWSLDGASHMQVAPVRTGASALEFSRNGQWLAVGLNDTRIQVLDFKQLIKAGR